MPKDTFFNLPAEKRDHIVSVAIDEFAEHGFAQASVNRIVAAAGIAKGSWYQYFDGLDDLFMHIMDEGRRKKAQFWEDHPPPQANMGIFEYIEYLLVTGLQYDLGNPKISRVAERAFYGDSPLADEFVQRMETQAMGFYRNLVSAAHARGDLRADIDTEAAVFVLYAVSKELGRYVSRRLNMPDDETDMLGYMHLHKDETLAIYKSVFDIVRKGIEAR